MVIVSLAIFLCYGDHTLVKVVTAFSSIFPIYYDSETDRPTDGVKRAANGVLLRRSLGVCHESKHH